MLIAPLFFLMLSTTARSFSLLPSPHLVPSLTSRLLSVRGGSDIPKPFPSWTFKDPCTVMEITPLPKITFTVTPSAPAPTANSLTIYTTTATTDDKATSELTLPTTISPLFSPSLSAALTSSLSTFKNGTHPGATTPPITIPEPFAKAELYSLGHAPTPQLYAALGAHVAAVATAHNVESINIVLPTAAGADDAKHLATKLYAELYCDDRYRKASEDGSKLTAVNLSFDGAAPPSSCDAALSAAAGLAAGVFMTKDVVNSPPNVLNPLSMASTAIDIASMHPDMTCKIIEKEECEEMGMGAFLAVARGSETDPKFIHMTWKPKNTTGKKLAIVGKGLTFDAGGYNIKTAMMELMKFDCGGSAAVLGAARSVVELEPAVEVHFIVASCENMINEKAMRPGDVLTASNGKTIEVLNTDAEGRLTLADALVYADKTVGADKIVELSTLTGACMISLGDEIAGVWCGDDELAEEIEKASQASSDDCWRMPLKKSYNKLVSGEERTMGGRGDWRGTNGRNFIRFSPFFLLASLTNTHFARAA